MQGVAILVGLTNDHVRRVKAAIRGGARVSPQWQLQFVEARRTQPAMFDGEANKAMEIASNHADSHIIGVSALGGDARKTIARRIRRHFRFRWLDNKLLSAIGGAPHEFVMSLAAVLEEEAVWAEMIKPRDVHNALLLPGTCFQLRPHTDNIWDLAEQYGDARQIMSTAKQIEIFRARHRCKREVSIMSSAYQWCDARDLFFDNMGARHGIAPFPRNWKYSFRVEDGFHFDVSHEPTAPFTFTDSSGTLHKAQTHLNVDPHGHVR